MQPRSPRSRRRRRRRQVEREATFSKRQTTFGVGGGSDDVEVELEAERGKREQVGNLPCRVAAAAENRGLPFLEDFRTLKRGRGGSVGHRLPLFDGVARRAALRR